MRQYCPDGLLLVRTQTAAEGKIDAKAEITEDVLVASGLVRRKLDGVRVLAKGEITSAITLTVTGASKPAIEAVEKAGGKLNVAAVAAE